MLNELRPGATAHDDGEDGHGDGDAADDDDDEDECESIIMIIDFCAL